MGSYPNLPITQNLGAHFEQINDLKPIRARKDIPDSKQ